MSLWPLLGIVVLVIGFAAGINPLIAIVAAAVTTGVAAGLSPLHLIAALGKAYNDSRYVSIIWLVLPVMASVLGHLAEDYAGEHWLATFALLALDPN